MATGEPVYNPPIGGGGSSGITIGTTTITGGADTQVLFNDGGAAGSNAGLTYNKTTGTLAASELKAGADKSLLVANTSNSASATSTLKATVGGTNADEARLQLGVTGSRLWTMGVAGTSPDTLTLRTSGVGDRMIMSQTSLTFGDLSASGLGNFTMRAQTVGNDVARNGVRNISGMFFDLAAYGATGGGAGPGGLTTNRMVALTPGSQVTPGDVDNVVIGDDQASSGADVSFITTNVVRQKLLAAGGCDFKTGYGGPATLVASGTYTVTAADRTIVVTGTTGATINLPVSPTFNQEVVVKDRGLNAAGANITVAGNGHNIVAAASATTHVISTNGASFTYIYDGSLWVVV